MDYYRNYLYAGGKPKTMNFEYAFRFGEQVVFYAYAKCKLTEEKLIVDSRVVL